MDLFNVNFYLVWDIVFFFLIEDAQKKTVQ